MHFLYKYETSTCFGSSQLSPSALNITLIRTKEFEISQWNICMLYNWVVALPVHLSIWKKSVTSSTWNMWRLVPRDYSPPLPFLSLPRAVLIILTQITSTPWEWFLDKRCHKFLSCSFCNYVGRTLVCRWDVGLKIWMEWYKYYCMGIKLQIRKSYTTIQFNSFSRHQPLSPVQVPLLALTSDLLVSAGVWNQGRYWGLLSKLSIRVKTIHDPWYQPPDIYTHHWSIAPTSSTDIVIG